MKKHLILVKHSLPEIVENLPAREWKLSAEGRIRAGQLAERLLPFQPEYIISSIEPKAKETAEIIAGRHNLEIHCGDDLHERWIEANALSNQRRIFRRPFIIFLKAWGPDFWE
jgi:broad specificity phosphatase PhoE